jgi:transposase
LNKINEIHGKYGLKTVVFVGDRGMVTQANYDEINHDAVKVISALKHNAIKSLCDKGTIQLNMFDEKNVVEVIDGNLRYCLCKNPDMASKEATTRQALLQRTKEELDVIVSSTRKSKYSKEVRAGKVISKFKMGKFFSFEGAGDNLSYSLNNEKIAQEAALDGCYIIYSDVAEKDMTALRIVENYKNLMRVEQAFRSMKTVRLEIRPVFHKKDERIQCHVFICMLAYYVMWHIKQLVRPIFDENEDGKKRKYTFDSIMEILKCIRQETVEFCNAKTHVITKATEEQRRILNILGVTI